MNSTIEFLLREPWMEYAVRTQLLQEDPHSPACLTVKEKSESHQLVQKLFDSLEDWEKNVVSTHKSALLLYNNLIFLADLGFTIEHPLIQKAAEIILTHTDENGVPQVLINVPKHFGGTGTDDWGWALCDAPAVLYALLRIGIHEDRLQSPIDYFASLMRDNGWPCKVSKELGKFRGPGKKDDPCAYATLIMLRLLLKTSKWRESDTAKKGAEAILYLWENSLQEHPYMFFMGTDFRKLKAPLIWYDIASVTEVLSQCSWLKQDKRLQEMINLMTVKADENGMFTPESIYVSMKDWDFGQKKKPSAWLTFCILRIINRIAL